MLLGAVTLVLTAGCGSDGESSGSGDAAPVLEGVYRGNASSDFVWAGFGGDRYALWKAGAACNDDVASAPADCAETGSFSFDASAKTITLVDDETGQPQAFDASFGLAGGSGSLTESGQLTAKNVPSGGELVGRDQETAKASSDRLVVADVSVVKKGIHVIFVACSLLTGNPEPLPEPIRPPPITQTQTGNGGKGNGCKK